MPTSGSIVSFNQSLPIYADKPFIDNTFRTSLYHSFSENYIGSGKFLISTIHGLNDEDVRISKRKSLSSKRLRGFERGKVGLVDLMTILEEIMQSQQTLIFLYQTFFQSHQILMCPYF